MRAILRYDAACYALAKALAEAQEIGAAKQVADKSDALRIYARKAKNKTLEVDAAEIRIRSVRRVGELMTAQRETVGLNKGAKGSVVTGFKRNPVKDDRPTLSEAGIDKNLADSARKFAAVLEPQFEALITEWRARVQQETERVTTNLLREGERELKRVERVAAPLPAGKYALLYADPPWRYEHIETENRAIENQYPTMSLEDICALDVPAADDAVLFLWATSPKLSEAMRVLEAWRFEYRTCAVWDKGVIGMGYYFRQQHELLLVAACGTLPVPEPSRRVSSVIRLPRAGHSEKPIEVYELLEGMYPDFGPQERIELFARHQRDGWAPAWGNEHGLSNAIR